MPELETTGSNKFLKIRHSTLTGDAKWKDIEDLINRWARRNPSGALENEQWIKQAHADLADKKHGKLVNEAMAGGRHGISIHPELMQYIQAFYPTFMDTKEEMHEFMKRFKKFRVPDET